MKRARGAARGVVIQLATFLLFGVVAGIVPARSQAIAGPSDSGRQVAAQLGRTSGVQRYRILYDLKSANRIATGLTVADLNAIIAGMEDQRTRVISLMARELVPNLSAADVVALSGQTRGSSRYAILYDLKSANRIATGLTVADLNAIIAGMEDQRTRVISLMARELVPNLSAADVVASSRTSGTAPAVGANPQTSASPAATTDTSVFAGAAPSNSSVGTLVERLIKSIPENPPYLYEVDTFTGAVATVATDLFGSKEKRTLYDEYYFAAIEYRTMANVQLILARRAARRNDDVTARDHVNQAMRLLDRRNANAAAASDVYVGNTDTTYARVEPVYKVSAVTARILARVDPTPLTSTVVDAVFTGADYCVNRANLGADAAKDELIRDVAVTVLMQMPTQSLGGRSIADVIERDATKKIGSSGIYRILDEQWSNPAFQKQFMSVLAKSGAAGAELVAERAFTDLLRAPGATDMQLFDGS